MGLRECSNYCVCVCVLGDAGSSWRMAHACGVKWDDGEC